MRHVLAVHKETLKEKRRADAISKQLDDANKRADAAEKRAEVTSKQLDDANKQVEAAYQLVRELKLQLAALT